MNTLLSGQNGTEEITLLKKEILVDGEYIKRYWILL